MVILKKRTVLVLLAWTCSLLAAVAGGFWAARQTLIPPEPVTDVFIDQTFSVEEKSIGQHADVSVDFRWESEPVGNNRASGIITSVDAPSGQQLVAGQLLFTTNLSPTVIAQGDVPSFRDLQQGDLGTDVKQLETLLQELQLFEETPDEVFNAATHRAVRAWQETLGVQRTGVALASMLYYVPDIRTPFQLASDLKVGNYLSGGEELLSALVSSPKVSFPFAAGSRLVDVSTGMKMTIDTRGKTLDAIVGELYIDEDGNRGFYVLETDGTDMCVDGCEELRSSTGHVSFPGEVEVEPIVTGPAVPLSAIASLPNGQSVLYSSEGEEIPVEIKTSDASFAVVSGVAVGDTVQLFAVPRVQTEALGGHSSTADSTPTDG